MARKRMTCADEFSSARLITVPYESLPNRSLVAMILTTGARIIRGPGRPKPEPNKAAPQTSEHCTQMLSQVSTIRHPERHGQ